MNNNFLVQETMQRLMNFGIEYCNARYRKWHRKLSNQFIKVYISRPIKKYVGLNMYTSVREGKNENLQCAD